MGTANVVAIVAMLAAILLRKCLVEDRNATKKNRPGLGRRLVGVGLFALALPLACATAAKPRAEASPPRAKDSAPDKRAALDAANPELGLEANDARWGISAAEEREADRKQQKPPAGTTPAGTGRVDVTPPPATAPAAPPR
jgi:hypothetical protein